MASTGEGGASPAKTRGTKVRAGGDEGGGGGVVRCKNLTSWRKFGETCNNMTRG